MAVARSCALELAEPPPVHVLPRGQDPVREAHEIWLAGAGGGHDAPQLLAVAAALVGALPRGLQPSLGGVGAWVGMHVDDGGLRDVRAHKR